jgi:hypothetical protein
MLLPQGGISMTGNAQFTPSEANGLSMTANSAAVGSHAGKLSSEVGAPNWPGPLHGSGESSHATMPAHGQSDS